MPFLLVTNRPEIKSIKDFKEGHKIAVPGVKNSNQAICLQMAAAKEWGQAELRAARSVHDHAAASGRRYCDHL